MEAWGFDYRSHQAWVKDKPGTGYWFRNEHELLLVGVRGTEVPAPAPGQNWPSTIYAPVGRHSEKPEVVYEMIERLYPTTPKMELNARRERAGWDNWGLDAPSAQAPLIEILPPVRTITPPTIAREIEEDHPGIPDFLKREAIAAA
jgi:N6-adenosine-specific RNA methylase IME4